MIRVIDVHVHTTASDGSYTPAGVAVELPKKAGLAAIAITDHDTVHGVNEAVQAAANESLEVVPGVEISVGDTDNMHILGLYIDPGSAPLQDKLRFLKDSRRKRNRADDSKAAGAGLSPLLR